MKFFCLVIVCFAVCSGSKVLVVFPVPGGSHGIIAESVAKILAEDGHEVTVVSPFPKENLTANINYVDTSSLLAPVPGRKSLNMFELYQNPLPIHHMQHVGPMFAQNTLEHPAVQAMLLDPDVTFDVVIVEWFFNGLLAPLAAVYDCPIIWYRSNDFCWQSLQLVHEASSPTYSRDVDVPRTPSSPFTFNDRLHQLWIQIYINGWKYFVKQKVEIPAYKQLYREPMRIRKKPLPDYDSLVYNASLILSASHPPFGQKLALPLNAKYVGGHHIEETVSPLPKNLKKVLDESKNGVILFSMGSVLKGKDMPDSLKRPLLDMFGRLKQTVIWKIEEKIDNLPKNVHIMEWVPQQSVLNHPNTALLINHGGFLTLVEATHFAVPSISIPVFGDQFTNIDQVVERGCGLRVDFSYDLPEKLKAAIERILGDHSFYENCRLGSMAFRRRTASPQTELKHWVQLVIDTKGALHLRSPALQVSTLDRLYLDVLFILILIFWFLTKVVKVIQIHLKPDEDEDKKNA